MARIKLGPRICDSTSLGTVGAHVTNEFGSIRDCSLTRAIKPSSKQLLRPEAEIATNPDSEQELREREAITERERLLHELGRCFTNLYL